MRTPTKLGSKIVDITRVPADDRSDESTWSGWMPPVVLTTTKVGHPGQMKSPISQEIIDCLAGPKEEGQP